MPRITAWGNSHGVRLPRELLEAADLAPQAEVRLTAEPGRIVIESLRRKPTLVELLAKVRPSDRFEEIDYGPPQGREAL